jgi:hypothetical protein
LRPLLDQQPRMELRVDISRYAPRTVIATTSPVCDIGLGLLFALGSTANRAYKDHASSLPSWCIASSGEMKTRGVAWSYYPSDQTARCAQPKNAMIGDTAWLRHSSGRELYSSRLAQSHQGNQVLRGILAWALPGSFGGRNTQPTLTQYGR